MKRYDVIPYKRWEHESGRTASIYGALPFYDNGKGWQIVTKGFTVRDNLHNTTGFEGRKPFETKQEAEEFIKDKNYDL